MAKQVLQPRYYVQGAYFSWGVYDRKRRTRRGRHALVSFWTYQQEAENIATALNAHWWHCVATEKSR